MPGVFKRGIISSFLIAATLLAATGTLDRGLGVCGFERWAQVNTRYLDDAFDNALAGFLILSGIKGGLAVVEGSTIGIGVNLELGDMVQPVYDYVDMAWKAAMAGASIIVVMQLALQGITLFDHWALAWMFFFWFAWYLAGGIFPGYSRLLRVLFEFRRLGVVSCVILYLLLPLTVSGAVWVSRQITRPIQENSHAQLASIADAVAPEALYRRFFPEGQAGGEPASLDIKGKIARMGEEVKNLVAFLSQQTEHIAALALKLIAAYLFDCIVFPLLFGLIMMTLVKSGIRYLFELDRRPVS